MKKAILFISILLTSIIIGYGQNSELIFKNKNSGMQEIIQEGKLVRVVCNNDMVRRGKLRITDTVITHSNTQIFIDSFKISIEQIKAIKIKKTLSSGNKIIGGGLTGLGGLLTIGGITTLAQDVPSNAGGEGCNGCLNASGATGIVLGVAVIIAGVYLLTGGKQYKSKDWDISIRIK